MKHWSCDPRQLLRPDADFDISSFDFAGTPGWKHGKKHAKAHTDRRGQLLPELQERLFAEGRAGGNRAVLCIAQGLDTAGKGGIARHVMSYVDPQGVALRSFGVPTEEEQKHHYLWRIRKALPPAGRIGVFDRSQYEDVLVVRVEDLVPPNEWEKRYDEINAFEAEVAASGTTVLKFAMMVSYEEQGQRLMERLDRPDKRWKYNPGDLKTRARYMDYLDAYQAIFELTNTGIAPWYVLPADHKWYPRLAITEILTRTLIEMRLAWPGADFDVEQQREELADTMSTASLAESYENTEDVVTGAIADSTAVRELEAEVEGWDEETAEHHIKKFKKSRIADLRQTLAQKQDLLSERSDHDS